MRGRVGLWFSSTPPYICVRIYSGVTQFTWMCCRRYAPGKQNNYPLLGLLGVLTRYCIHNNRGSEPSAHSLFCLPALRQQLVFLQHKLIVTYGWFLNCDYIYHVALYYDCM